MKAGPKPSRFAQFSWREIPDQISFIVAFALGALGSLYLKSSNVDLPVVAAVYAGSIILLYALMAGIAGRWKFEPEAIGDNCYYLGFLITLSSLAYTLYQVDAAETATGGDGTGDIIPEVISGFGVALSSTIFGVFLRVLFMRLRPDPENIDPELRAEINRSFRELKKSMSGMMTQMKKFSEESVKLASERDQRIRASTEKFAEDYRKSLEASSEFLSGHMKETFTGLVQQAMQDISVALLESGKAYQAHMEEAIKGLQAVKERLQEQETGTLQEILERRKRLANELEASEQLLSSHAEAMNANSRAVQNAAEAMENRIIPSLEAFEARMKASADSLTSGMKESFTEMARQALEEVSAAVFESRKSHMEQMEEAYREMQELNRRLREQEAETLEEILARRRRREGELANSEKLMSTHAEALKASYRAAARVAESIEKRIVPRLGFIERLIQVERANEPGERNATGSNWPRWIRRYFPQWPR